MSELKEGGPCQVFKNGWRPATLVKMGRKHAIVKFADKETNSHVPASAVKELKVGAPKEPAPTQAEAKEEDGYFLDESDPSYLKIRNRSRMVALVPRAYRNEADTMLNALRDTEEVRMVTPSVNVVQEFVKANPIPESNPLSQEVQKIVEKEKSNAGSALDRL